MVRPCLAFFLIVAGLSGCVAAPDSLCPTCGQRDDAGVDAGPEPDTGPRCRVHTDCDEDRYCHQATCVECFTTERVDGDELCGEGRICVESRCKQGCRGPADCSEARPICTERGPTGGTCRQCSEDAHCVDHGFGNTCVNNVCTTTCGPNLPCAEGVCDNDSQTCVACLEDTHCGASGLICTERACIPGCRDDRGCGEGTVCEDDDCVRGCRPGDDDACGADQLCEGDANPSACIPGDCRSASDCLGAGERCVNHFCGTPCGVDADCNFGALCVDNNCQPGCRAEAPGQVDSCGDGAFCRAGECIRGCPDDDACRGGQICLENNCLEGCRDDDACEGGRRCIDHNCQRGCRDDSHCLAGQTCSQNQCLQTCRQDASCGPGRICVPAPGGNEPSICVEGCREHADCGQNSHCAEGQCAPGCVDSGQCDDGDTCYQGQCTSGCRANGSGCPAGLVCNRQARACVQCLSDNNCRAPLTCEERINSCVLRCQRSSDCPGGAICSGNHCVPCRNDGQCSNGLHCDPNSGCVVCTANEHCDRGEVCDAIRRRCTAPNLHGVCQPDASLGGCTNGGRQDCQDGLRCYQIRNGRDLDSSYCLQPCERNAQCPRGFFCLERGACYPFSSRQRLTCEAYAELGTRCTNSQECGNNRIADDAICSGYGRYSNPPRCSWFCASNTDCPANHVCEDPPMANGNDPLPRCTPAP